MTGGPRAWVGLARSLVIYRARPWKIGRLARLYGGFLGPGDLAFDIGAHVGNRTHAMLRAGARVVALEPQRLFHDFLKRDLPASVTLMRAAAGAREGGARLAVSRLHPTVSTIAPGFAGRMGGASGFEHVRWDGAEMVEVTTLDALIFRHGLPRFVKIDVEGYELEVLSGLSQPLPWIAFEALPAAWDLAMACVERLAALGPYRFNAIEGEGTDFVNSGWTGAAALPRLGRGGDIYARLDG